MGGTAMTAENVQQINAALALERDQAVGAAAALQAELAALKAGSLMVRSHRHCTGSAVRPRY